MGTEITIRQNDNGEFAIQSSLPGPAGTIHVLRQVIAAVEKAALEAELKANAAAVRPATAGQLEAALKGRMNGSRP